TAVSMAVGGAVAPRLLAEQAPAQPAPAPVPRPAEALIQELYQGLTEAQRRSVVYPWDHGATQTQLPVPPRMFNQAYGQRASQVYTRPQQELIQRIVRAICSDEEGFRRIATVVEHDNWNNSAWQGVGSNIFGDPTRGQFAWVLTAHHLTLRCD